MSSWVCEVPKSVAGRIFSGEAFSAAFTVFLLGGFLLRPNAVWAFIYYAAVLPTFLALAWRRRGAVSFADPALGWAFLAIAWFGLSLTWGIDQPPGKASRYLVSVVVNSTFVLCAYAFFAGAQVRWLTLLQRLLPLAAAANAVIAFAVSFSAGSGGELLSQRLSGWAETRHPILGADVMCIALMFALHRITHETAAPWRMAAVAAMALGVSFVLATGSRGPLLALVAGTACFIALSCPRRFPVVAIGAVAALAAAYALVPGAAEFQHANLERNSYRLEIWREVIDLAQQRPLLGYGAANSHWFVRPDITFPHSLYMSALYYAGIVGLGLVIGLFGIAAVRAWRDGGDNRPLLLALLAVTVVAGLTDVGQFVKSPSELWYILWLPLTLIFGLSRRKRGMQSWGEA